MSACASVLIVLEIVLVCVRDCDCVFVCVCSWSVSMIVSVCRRASANAWTNQQTDKKGGAPLCMSDVLAPQSSPRFGEPCLVPVSCKYQLVFLPRNDANPLDICFGQELVFV